MGATATTMTSGTSSGRLEQQMEALGRANACARNGQSSTRPQRRPTAIEEVLSHPPEYLASATILDLLIWTPKRKRTKANRVLLRCHISPSRTVGG